MMRFNELTPGIDRYQSSAMISLLAVLFLANFIYAENLVGESQVGPARQTGHFYPFEVGESALYEASWSGIPVASAEIHASSMLVHGKRFYEVKVQARTWRYLELIWKMRDSIESVFEAQTFQPHRFVFRQRENRKKVDTTALFDPGAKKWVVHRRQGDKIKEYEFVSSRTFDPISATYLARSLDWKVGDTLQIEVFGGGSRYLVTLDVVGKEPITVKAGVFDAYKIIPRVANLARSGYAARVREATAWISADERRRPLKMISQVFIGSVSIEMVGEKS